MNLPNRKTSLVYSPGKPPQARPTRNKALGAGSGSAQTLKKSVRPKEGLHERLYQESAARH